MKLLHPFSWLAVAACCSLPQLTWACAACGCTLSGDWDSLGATDRRGLTVDLRYDYLNQTELRAGTGRISPAEVAAQGLEVERYTRSNDLTASLSYTFSPDWGATLQLPYIVRNHSTLGSSSDGLTPGDGAYDAHTSSLGDARLVGRYQGVLASGRLSLLGGLKLPTGSHQATGVFQDPTLTDPAPIDRGLQPGTGTTDLIAGLLYADTFNANWAYLAQALFQSALHAVDGYRPGNSTDLDLGVRYTAATRVQPQLQLNYRHLQRDSGINADTVSTGGTLVYLSPGLNMPLSRQTAVYVYVQMPVYQNVNGAQLVPRYTASWGLRHAF